MSAAVSPLTRVRGPSVKQIFACAALVATAGVWAFWPLDLPEVRSDDRGPDPSETPSNSNIREMRLASFNAPLWVVPPAPPPAPPSEPEPTPPPPLKLQLLAVVNQEGVYEAVLFDPESDKLYTVREGQTLGIRTVERVDPTGVDLSDDAGTRTLALQSDGGASEPQPKGTRR